MKDVIAGIIESLKKNEPVVLATIVSSSGSSPLPSGAMMMVKSGTEETIGTVGGGLLEALVIEEAKKCLAGKKKSDVGTFDLNGDVSNEGMICGGTVDVLLEPLAGRDLPVFEGLARLRNDGIDSVLARSLKSSGVEQRLVLSSKDEEIPPPLNSVGLDPAVAQTIRHAFGREDVRRVKVDQFELILQPIQGLQDLVIFGGGHVSQRLAQIATVAGFSTTVVDDREEYANPARFPGVHRVFASAFEEAISKLDIRPSTCLVIVTRGHAYDKEVLARAMTTPAKYIGMIGSKRKVIACFEELAQRGIPLSKLRNVHAPIGLDIGSITAEEIAVSIVAELIRVRRGFTDASNSLSIGLADWFHRKS